MPPRRVVFIHTHDRLIDLRLNPITSPPTTQGDGGRMLVGEDAAAFDLSEQKLKVSIHPFTHISTCLCGGWGGAA